MEMFTAVNSNTQYCGRSRRTHVQSIWAEPTTRLIRHSWKGVVHCAFGNGNHISVLFSSSVALPHRHAYEYGPKYNRIRNTETGMTGTRLISHLLNNVFRTNFSTNAPDCSVFRQKVCAGILLGPFLMRESEFFTHQK